MSRLKRETYDPCTTGSCPGTTDGGDGEPSQQGMAHMCVGRHFFLCQLNSSRYRKRTQAEESRAIRSGGSDTERGIRGEP